MRLSRPTFRPWRSVAAVLLAYLAAGALYRLADFLNVLVHAASRPSELDAIFFVLFPIVVLYESALTALSTLYNVGFPFVDIDSNAQANLYPIIVPVACLLLALANGALTFERKSGGSNRKGPRSGV